MAGGQQDWEALINHMSSMLTETKNLVGKVENLLDEVKAQTRFNIAILTISIVALIVAIFK